jgi:hypothetical protein
MIYGVVSADMEGVDSICSTTANGGWTDEMSTETSKRAPGTVRSVLVVQSVVHVNGEETLELLCIVDGDWLIEETSSMTGRSLPLIGFIVPPHLKHCRPVMTHEEDHPDRRRRYYEDDAR